MKKIIQVLLCSIIITSFTGCSKVQDSTVSTSSETTANVTKEKTDTNNAKLTNIENDAYILYSLCYDDALRLSGSSSNSIKTKTTDTQTVYTFVEHVLSCGTHMNGEIVEDVKDNIKTLSGSFNVTKNPYEITNLKLNITIDTKTDKKTGYLSANGKEVDINSNFMPPS